MKQQIKGNLKVSVFKEGEHFIANCTDLDLVTYGDSYEQALKHFDEALEGFIEECVAKGVLRKVLLECGFQEDRKTLKPPEEIGTKLIPLELLNAKINSNSQRARKSC